MGLIFIYDTETTGLPNWNAPSEHPSQPHIVQLACGLYDVDTGAPVELYDKIVRPHGWTIPDEVAAIHGITTERAADEGLPEWEVLSALEDMWGRAMTRTAYNESFDARIVRIAMKRFRKNGADERWSAAAYCCTMRLAKPLTGMKKTPKLVEAYQHFFGRALVGAHSAVADRDACAEVYFHIKGIPHAGMGGPPVPATDLFKEPPPAPPAADLDDTSFL